MSLKLKLTTLIGISLALVVTTACKGGSEQKVKDAAKEACTQVQRICKDGSNAVREGETSCYQKCPEDTSTTTTTSTVTDTNTVTSTVTTTNTRTGN